MEHILIAQGGALTEYDVVPYVATDDFRHLSFVDFMRTRWSTAMSTDLIRTRREEYHSLMQTWLFFGLYKQVIGDFFEPGHYVVVRDNPSAKNAQGQSARVLCTEKLVSALTAWSEYAIGDPDAKDRMPIIRECWERLSDSLTPIYNSRYLPTAMATSLLSTTELLFRTITRTFPELDPDPIISSGQPFTHLPPSTSISCAVAGGVRVM